MAHFTLNGAEVTLDLPDHASLLHALRGPLGLSSPRFGCGAEQCGSCMVLLDGKPAYACALGLDAVAGRKVVTVEGLGTTTAPHPLQTAFLAEQAGQCGYCLSGMLISAAAAAIIASSAPSGAPRRRWRNESRFWCCTES